MPDTFNITGNGNTDMGYVGEVPRFQSYLGTLFVAGTFGGGTLKFQASPDDVTWFDIPDQAGNVVNITAQSMRNLEFGTGGIRLRAVLSGATSPNLKVWLKDTN
ncbi:hypothetical protein K3G63_04640 [Hymenobacter sp. HSC-4F20]|uniref:hypothetical protein n=1 Tax=Hymenobacter sp. HSC-4F20 TaxID=2864135 RepID=UPI001C7373E2|nr:hypothetical protein [Hymenobacter sp. HSC-4F20]MBX0289711.1 hypothetical protein [Hymenobacter sp. HSC-4F20]